MLQLTGTWTATGTWIWSSADLDEPIAIYENHSTGHRVIIQLKGTSGNTHGVGAMIELSAAQSGSQVRWAQSGSGIHVFQ